MKGNYQPLPRPVPFDKVLDQQAEDKQPTGKNNAGEPLVMLSLRLPVRLKNRLKIAAAEHGTPCNRSRARHRTRTRPTRQQRLNKGHRTCRDARIEELIVAMVKSN